MPNSFKFNKRLCILRLSFIYNRSFFFTFSHQVLSKQQVFNIYKSANFKFSKTNQMNKIFRLIYPVLIALIILNTACTKNENAQVVSTEKVLYTPNNDQFTYVGRVDLSNSSEPVIFWAGSGFVSNFTGTSVKVTLDDNSGNNYFNAIIDDNTENIIVIKCNKGEESYLIAENMEDKEHKIEFYKRTDPTTSSTIFKGIYIDEGKTVSQPASLPDYKIEFYGNSITSGHGIHDVTGNDNDNRVNWDNYYSYGAITARNLNADYRCISMSGIGLTVSWYELIMPQMFNRLNPNDSDSEWDFSLWQADIVVINLFQNDSWLINNLSPVPTDSEIINKYVDFIQDLRSKYSNAKIICTLGCMSASNAGSVWRGYIESAVNIMNNQNNDDNVYCHILPFIATTAHPTTVEHETMATDLLQYINQIKNK